MTSNERIDHALETATKRLALTYGEKTTDLATMIFQSVQIAVAANATINNVDCGHLMSAVCYLFTTLDKISDECAIQPRNN